MILNKCDCGDTLRCTNPEHDNYQCCWNCCDTCKVECSDPEWFGWCGECNKPYELASNLDHNPETGLHYGCETGFYKITLTGAMRDEIEQVLLDILYDVEYGTSYNQVLLLDALTIIEEAERRVL